MAPAAAFISLPIRRRSEGNIELSAVVERQQDGDESSHHIPTELWPQGDDQTVVAELRGEDQKTAVMGEADSNPNSDFVEEKSSGTDLPDSNASQGPSEAAEHPVGKLQEHEECDRGHLEPEGRMGEEQDAARFIDQRLIKMMTEGQHFGRNSDRRRLPTAGRFGTLSLKMEADSPTVAERAMWSAPVPPPEANEAPLPAMDRAASRAASNLQREATHQERDQAIALRFYDGAREGPVEQRPMNSRGSLPLVKIGPSSAPSTLPHAALFDTSWRPTLAAYSSFASIPGFLGDTPERQASLGMMTATRQSIPPTLVQRRSSIPSSGAYKHVLSPKLTVLPPATQLVVGGREDPRGGVPGRTGDQNPGRHVNHHLVHHHKRPPGHTEHHATRHGGQHHYAGHGRQGPRHHDPH
ncbi:hypothetical protein FOZ62_001613 [Perkinsus olseni]|uniref:Uncharacterized protein n=1 Tax=Perkinsus olseni TaxID=32597 RepID=A0A7J6PUA9_PEROL|nr:hypothetical protein FOZ62_001613 [Perkinsus olseni]